MNFKHITTEAIAESYKAIESVFSSILPEVREFSKKKPEAMLTEAKVKIVNPVLVDVLAFLRREPESKYLAPIDEDALLQVSDALLHMAPFRAALDSFRSRYTLLIEDEECWVTPERIAEWKAEGVFDDDEEEDDDDDDGGDAHESWQEDDDDETWEED